MITIKRTTPSSSAPEAETAVCVLTASGLLGLGAAAVSAAAGATPEQALASGYAVGPVVLGATIALGRRGYKWAASDRFNAWADHRPIRQVSAVFAGSPFLSVGVLVLFVPVMGLGLLDAGYGRAVRRYRSGAIHIAAACMPAHARERWLDTVAESLHETPPEKHDALVRNFIANAPIEIHLAWSGRRRAGSER